ncbi:MAG TPA: hypothetical protein VGI45_27290 [Terracidiphilus sp.]|jgi:hypothetical protein
MMEVNEALNRARTNQTLVRPLLAESDRDRSFVFETAPPLSLVGSSVLFSVLQSVCTAVVALNSVRLAIGIGSLAMTTGLGATMEHFHQITWLRVTLLVGALSGSILTLGIVLRAIHLRNRPAARWRFRPQSSKQKRMELLQISLSVVTLLLVVVEEYLHFRLCHTL